MVKGELGKKLATARKAAGLSQAELADRLGWDDGQSRVSNYERERRSPDLYDLERIAKELKLTVPAMLYDEKHTAKTAMHENLACNIIIAIEDYLNNKSQKLEPDQKARLFIDVYSRLSSQPEISSSSILTILNVSFDLKTNL